MDKEGSVNTRGKRRSKNTEEINTEPDIYKKCIDFEEQEAKSRDPMDDAKIYLNTCKRLKTLLSEIFKMKSCNDNENKDELQLKCRECYMLVCILKKLNRLEKVRMQAGREKLNSEKQKLENLTLQLQNLLYELDHLLSEYCKCKQYKSKDEDIELISTQQFLQLAPEDFKQKFQDVAPDDPIYVHELHLAMLEHELSQRIELYKLCESLELNKKQLSKDIVTQKEKLNALDPKYDAIVAAAKVLQQHLGLSSDEIRPEHELARFLPNQLYLLYCTLEVYKEVKDASVKIDILGNLEEVKLYNEERNSSIANNSDVEDVLEEVVEVKKRRRSGKTAAVVDKLEEKRKRLLQKHPLALMVTLVSSLKYELKITFTYRTFLRIITVESAADVPSNANINGNCARDVLNGESLLNELFAGDFGTESPNLANLYQFKEVGLCSYESLIPKMGHAYAWAQKLCGQNFLDMQNQKVDRNKQTVELESTLKAICERMKSRVALAQQLQHLEQNIISTLPDYLEYPKNAISTLTKFQSISYQSFCTDCYNAQFLVDNEFVSASDLFYFATIVRPKATLKAHIVVKNAYPSKAPIVILKISNGGDCHGGNSDEIRDIERVINIGLEDSFKNIEDAATHLLSLQLRLLCSLMDVYLETNENTSFSRNATFFHNVFGRNRRRPFRYKKIGNGIFTDEVKSVLKSSLKAKQTTNLENLQKTFKKTDRDLKTPFDQAFRDVLLDLIENEAGVKELENLITLSINCCRLDITTASIPVLLLSDIFDLLTTDACAHMFHYVEQHVHIWKEEIFFSSCKNILLRMCNDLLRRLSKSNATIFCGRILLFLAKFFPFSERSGLNIVSEFNLENRTEFGTENADDDKDGEVEVDEEKKAKVVDYNLYCKFWSLQDFFRNPNQCYDKVQWKMFASHATNILATFRGLKLEHVEKPTDWRKLEENDFEENIGYFSKYLTNRKLLDLQLYDVNFRRFVLLQFLILFQYLTSTVKFKTNAELTAEQKTFVQNTVDQVHALLKETPPDGQQFDSIVTNILSREEHWNSWKNDGCPEFRKVLPIASSVESEKPKTEKKKYLGDVIKEARQNGFYYMGNTELTKLWNLYPDNLEACKAKDRDFLPPLEGYFEEAIEQLDQNDSSKDSLLRDGNFGWRALRLLARRSPHFFTHNNKPITELHTYLDMMVRRIAADKPGTTLTQPENNETTEEEDLFKQPEETAEPEGEYQVQDYIPFRVALLTVNQFSAICKKLENDWQVLARKLGYKSDEIEYIASQNPEVHDQARSLLHLWFEEDDDSTLENFQYILEGLNLQEAAEELKLAMEQNKNLTTECSNSNENE